MSDSTGPRGDGDADKVSFAKKKKGPGATVAGGKVDMARPTTILALLVAMGLSGLFSIIAAALLYGHEGQIADNVRSSTPPISRAQAGNAGDKVGDAVAKALTGKSAGSSATVQAAQDAAGSVLDDKDVLPTKSISNDDRSDQKDKTRAAISAQLKGRSGTLTTTEVSTISSMVDRTTTSNLTRLSAQQADDIVSRANSTPKSLLISGVVLALALGLVGMGAYAGRYWGRWAVPVVWILASFTGTTAGFFSLTQLGSQLPTGYKVGAALSALSLIVAVGLAFVRPSRQWFDAHRPAMPEGMPQRRGLFMPRVPPPTGGSRATAGTTKPAKTAPAEPIDQSAEVPGRAKSRATTGESHTGNAGARSRPRQASKSRRTGES